jgi:hypothetical protein
MKRVFKVSPWLALLPWAVLPPAAPGFGLAVKSPPANARVKGPVTFAVSGVKGLSRLASVEYLLNGRPLSGPLMVAPYSYPWHSALAWDGPATVQAVARDADGKVLAKSGVVRFKVANGNASIRLVSPDPARPLRGVVKWAVEATRPVTAKEAANRPKGQEDPRGKPIEALLLFVDGKLWNDSPVFGTGKISVNLDTTRLANGRHELFVAAYSTQPGAPPVAMVQVPVRVDNGRAVRRIRSRWADLFLAPGETAPLEPRLVYTDNSVERLPKGAAFATSDPSVAAVSEGGTVRAKGPGVADVTVRWRGYKATTRVVVDRPHGFPHFSHDGHILTRYERGRSLWVRSVFGLDPHELRSDPKLPRAVHAAGVNALTVGFYLNPADQKSANLAAWRKSWEAVWQGHLKTARDNSLYLLLTGDDIARTPTELANSVQNPWSADAIRLAFKAARDSKRVVCIDMVDEVSLCWGDTPTPADDNWAKRDPPVPRDAFVKLMKTLNGVKDRPPISWPIAGLSREKAARNWMGNPDFADYASLYWTYWDWRRAYPDRGSLPQDRRNMEVVVRDYQPILRRDRPMLMIASQTGPFYTKGGPGAEFTPGQDRLQSQGIEPAAAAAQIMYAAARGMAGVRVYHFDGRRWKDERRSGQAGRKDLQTGSDPFSVGTDRWQAMASAFNLIGRLEPHLLQPQTHAPDLGPTFVTGARRGPGSRLLLAVNFSESPEPARVDFRPYRFARGPAVVRYRLAGAALQVDTVSNQKTTDKVTFAPGEAVAWLFQDTAGGKDVVPPAVAFQSPPAGATVGGKVAVRVRAADDGKLDRVEFFVDGKSAGRVKAAPYGFTWDTAAAKKGVWHSLTAVAYDAAGNASEARIAVRVARP